MVKPKKKLIEKYDIPLHHLDFKYIEECRNAREVEKIYHILVSGEEGYFTELTTCAENKLRILNPKSIFLRKEDQLLGRSSLPKDEALSDWRKDIKNRDETLLGLLQQTSLDEEMAKLPAIRHAGTIQMNTDKSEEFTDSSKSKDPDGNNKNAKNSSRISSTDYNKWDKYNPDVEILRMDLAEERDREEAERLRKAKDTTNKQPEERAKITEIPVDALKHYSKVERQTLAEGYRLKGNDYFRAKEYDKAVGEYSLCIEMCPEDAAAGYNNRAIANIKLKKFLDAIYDCESCLSIEPDNLKALLRLAEANSGYGKKREAYHTYMRALSLDPSNAIALKASNELKALFGDQLPPPSATRLQIVESTQKADTSQNNEARNMPKPAVKEYDYVDLVKPNRVVKSKLAETAEILNKVAPKCMPKKPTKSEEQPELVLRTAPSNKAASGKLLIEEIPN